MAVGHGKGSLLIHTKAYVEKQGGPSAWNELLGMLSPDDRAVAGGIVLAGSWYPIGAINRLVARYCKAAPSPDDTMRALSSYIADNDLGTVYKMVLRLGSPELLVKRTGSLWNRYFDTGDLSPSQVGPQHWQLQLVMPADDDQAPNRFFCGPGCPAWIEMGLRLTGAKSPKVNHISCRFDRAGAPCIYDVRW